MNMPFATALILGVGLVPDLSVATVDRFAGHATLPGPGIRRAIPALIRRTAFDALPSAGRYARDEVAAFFIEDGRLYAEWTGQVSAPQPRRIETPDLDAEWMVQTSSTGWLLARRDLHPSADGRYWSVRISAGLAGPTELTLATEADLILDRRALQATRFTYVQDASGVRLVLPRPHDEHRMELVAGTITELSLARPELLRTTLAPAIRKIANVELAATC